MIETAGVGPGAGFMAGCGSAVGFVCLPGFGAFAGMTFGWGKGMEVDGGGLPKWWEKAGFGRMCSTFCRFPGWYA